MCFKDKDIAERFVEVMSELSILYMDDKRRFGMQFLAEIMKKMSSLGIISIDDLYELSEDEIINRIKECKNHGICECFEIWENSLNIKTSNFEIQNQYCVYVKAKKRYINPLVQTDNGPQRIADISDKARNNINKCLDYTFDRYIYIDFDLDDSKKIFTKK